ncbi:hypothetical protein [Agarivorans sp. OAG1]
MRGLSTGKVYCYFLIILVNAISGKHVDAMIGFAPGDIRIVATP